MATPGKMCVLFRSTARFRPILSKHIRFCSIYSNRAINIKYSTGVSSFQPINLFRKIVTQTSQVRTMGALSPLDPSSYSRPEIAIIKHISLSLNVDFEKKVLSGVAVLDLDVLEDTSEVILDESNLVIESVELADGTVLKYKLDENIPNYGSKLTITLPKSATSGDKYENIYEKYKEVKGDTKMFLKFNGFSYEPVVIISEAEFVLDKEHGCLCLEKMYQDNTPCYRKETIENDVSFNENNAHKCRSRLKIRIKYATSPSASALQWLDPNLTSGKKHPYLFSQCQPIHARSIMPCQDTPAVKFTYDAEVTAPEEFTVLMSALRGENKSSKTTFKQPVPIPSYLLAIAVGVLESRQLGPRSVVWSEKAEIERSAWEFAETEKYLQAAERLCGPYVWGQYDLLVLPPSFPYGGMENPCLTFVTPTLLAGDKSLADVLVHEIMHSWTGNLVTNRNFEHFWLNEGFTVFLERKVGASLIADSAEAKKSRDFHSILGLQELKETINQLNASSPLTQLVLDLSGVHPDDSFSRVPYEKGSLFLRYLEDTVGGPEVFDDFLRSYLDHYQRKSLDTDQFKAYLLNYFKDNESLKKVDWNTWLYTSGMPPVIPDYDTSMTKAVKTVLNKIEQEDSVLAPEDVSSLTPHQMINLLQELVDRPPLSLNKLHQLGTAYGVAASKNAELMYRWLRLCVRSKDESSLPSVFQFVNSLGRMKYVRPVYRDLYAWEDVRNRTIANFLQQEPYMMHVTAYTLRKDLALSQTVAETE